MTWFVDDLLARHARDTADELALAEGEVAVSWAELDRRVAQVADRLLGEGLAAGDRVAIANPSTLGAIVALLGVLRARGTAVPLHGGLTRRELDVALEVVAPAVVLDERWSATFDGRPVAPTRGDRRGPGDAEAPAVVVLTSGTTGRPKAVVLAGRALAASADAWLAALPAATGWAMPLGISHVAGLGVLWRSVRDRVPVTLLPGGDPEALLASLRSPAGPSHVSLVPPQLVRLLDGAAQETAPAGVRAVLLGGGTIPPQLVRRAATSGWPVIPTYGLSEMASGVTALRAEEAREAPDTAGLPLAGVSLEIEAPDADGVGEIVVRGPSRSSGYLGEPSVAVTEAVRTGDLGRLDAAGRLVVVDRRTDRVVRGGENIDPSEVEAALESHPAVAAAAVVGRPDETWGHVPVAAIVLRDATPSVGAPDDDELRRHLRLILAAYKVPAAFVRLDTLPRTSGGKVRRDAVRALVAGARVGTLARPDGDAIGWRVTGDGPHDLVLLHGTLSTAQQLDRLAQALAADGALTVHALDRRGAGSSRLADPRPLDVETHVADITAYLEARGIRRAILAGISFGGVIALETAARVPGRVEAVLAYEPPYGVVADEERLGWFRRVGDDTRRAHHDGGPAAAAETFLRAVAGDGAWDGLPARTRDALSREGDGALADAALTGLDPAGLEGIHVPVLLLTADASEPFYAPIADELASRIPGARRQQLPGLRHTSPITDPTPVAAAMRSFVDHLDPASLEPVR